MMLSLAIEYCETLSSLNTKAPVPIASLAQAIYRVADEETQRQGDEAFENFKNQLDSCLNDETMPVSDKAFKKAVSKGMAVARNNLRRGLSEILKFDEVLYE